MRRVPTAIYALAAITPFGAAAFAHHSQAMFDTPRRSWSREGRAVRLGNPHMYLIVETKGSDGKPALVEGEGLGITQALVDGLDREALMPGTPVVMRAGQIAAAGANRSASSTSRLRTARFIRSIRPKRTRALTPATSLEGHWAAARAALGAAFGAMARCPVTPEGRAAQRELAADGLCYVEPMPFLADTRRAAHHRGR